VNNGSTLRRATTSKPTVTFPTLRKAPADSALINSGVRNNPGYNKPAKIVHNARHKADRSGWEHRYRPFYFKHGGHRWHRHYYSYVVGGLWYWYWYDVIADTDPYAVLYSDAMLPDCDFESDACDEPEPSALVAPAILQGRATPEEMQRCADSFLSFNSETGTYVTQGGDVRICPYLM